MTIAPPAPTEVATPRATYADMEVGSHRVSLLRDGEQAYPAMLEAIAAARQTVVLETYILRDDGTGRRFAEVLCDRARAGVEVSVLYDAWGSSVSTAFVASLHAAGVRTVAFHPLQFAAPRREILGRLMRRDHKKTLVVDGEIGFTGGMNTSDDYASIASGGRGWRDTHIRIEGPAARELEYFFQRTWRRARGAPFDEQRYGRSTRRPDGKVLILTNDLKSGRLSIKDLYRRWIGQARERVWITNAYFLPTVRLLGRLTAAARRGVDVRIITAGTTDVTAVLYASRALYPSLLKAGVRIYEWRGRVLHAKTAVVDRHRSTVGSTNLDQQSLRFNLEVNAVVEDDRFAAAMEQMFEDDLPHCHEIRAGEWEATPVERAASWGAYLLKDWL